MLESDVRVETCYIYAPSLNGVIMRITLENN